MSSLIEIERAASQLPPNEKQKLLLSVAMSLRAEGQLLPQPRQFSAEQMNAWIEEDEKDMKDFRGQG